MNKYQKEFNKLRKCDTEFQKRFFPHKYKSQYKHKKMLKESIKELIKSNLIEDSIAELKGLKGYIQCAFVDERGNIE